MKNAEWKIDAASQLTKHLEQANKGDYRSRIHAKPPRNATVVHVCALPGIYTRKFLRSSRANGLRARQLLKRELCIEIPPSLSVRNSVYHCSFHNVFLTHTLRTFHSNSYKLRGSENWKWHSGFLRLATMGFNACLASLAPVVHSVDNAFCFG